MKIKTVNKPTKPVKGLTQNSVNYVKAVTVLKEPTKEEMELAGHLRIGLLTALKVMNLYSFQLMTMKHIVKQEEKKTLNNLLQITEKTINDIWRIKERKFKGASFDRFNEGLEAKIDFQFEVTELALMVMNDEDTRTRVLKEFERIVEQENKRYFKIANYKKSIKNDN